LTLGYRTLHGFGIWNGMMKNHHGGLQTTVRDKEKNSRKYNKIKACNHQLTNFKVDLVEEKGGATVRWTKK